MFIGSLGCFTTAVPDPGVRDPARQEQESFPSGSPMCRSGRFVTEFLAAPIFVFKDGPFAWDGGDQAFGRALQFSFVYLSCFMLLLRKAIDEQPLGSNRFATTYDHRTSDQCSTRRRGTNAGQPISRASRALWVFVLGDLSSSGTLLHHLHGGPALASGTCFLQAQQHLQPDHRCHQHVGSSCQLLVSSRAAFRRLAGVTIAER